MHFTLRIFENSIILVFVFLVEPIDRPPTETQRLVNASHKTFWATPCQNILYSSARMPFLEMMVCMFSPHSNVRPNDGQIAWCQFAAYDWTPWYVPHISIRLNDKIFHCCALVEEGVQIQVRFSNAIVIEGDLSVTSASTRDMMTSSNGNIFRVTGHLCRVFTGHRWIPRTKASDAERWCFLDLRLNKRLNKQSWGWWFETASHSLWRHCNECHRYRGWFVCHFSQYPWTSDLRRQCRHLKA